MTRFLANWEVESEIALPDDVPFLRYDHPASLYTVFIRNSSGDHGELSYLTMQLIFDAASIQDTKEISERHAKEFLDHLVLISNMRLRLRSILHVFNWESTAPTMRDCLYFTRSSPHDDGPYNALQKPLLETLAAFQNKEIDPKLRRALKWFGNGVASRYSDDQFAYFWFVIELVAQLIKATAPVADKCPVCKSPLYCETCGMTPLHRPYPKQAIQQLFFKYVPADKGPDEFYKRASDARNMLMHGDDTKAVEQALGIEFADLVDQMGELAWVSLMNQFVRAAAGKQLYLLRTNRYVHMNFSASAVMQVGFVPNFDNPDPSGFPQINVSFDRTKRKTQTEKTKPTSTGMSE